MAAILEVRGGAGDEDDLEEPYATNAARVVVMTLLMLAGVAAVVWWFS
jgi:hypothetical protein